MLSLSFQFRIGLPAGGLLLHEAPEGPFRFRFAGVDTFFALLLDAGQNSANRSLACRAFARPELFRQAIEEFCVHPFRLYAVRFEAVHFSLESTVSTFMTPHISSFLSFPLAIGVP